MSDRHFAGALVDFSDFAFRKRCTGGLEVVASTPDVMTATIASEMNRMGKIIKNAGIRAD